MVRPVPLVGPLIVNVEIEELRFRIPPPLTITEALPEPIEALPSTPSDAPLPMVTAVLPSETPLPRFNCPRVMEVAPVKVLFPVRVQTPLPVLERLVCAVLGLASPMDAARLPAPLPVRTSVCGFASPNATAPVFVKESTVPLPPEASIVPVSP